MKALRKTHTPNPWTAAPSDIISHIFNDHSDPLTKYLNGWYLTLTAEQSAKVWEAAFELDWDGDLKILPPQGFPSVRNGLRNVCTKGMYERLVKLRPEYSEGYEEVEDANEDPTTTNIVKPFEYWDRRLSTFKASLDVELEQFNYKPLHRLRHIVIKNKWFELLNDKSHPIALIRESVYFGYFDLLQHLGNEKGYLPTIKQNSHLLIADSIKHGHLNIFQFLFNLQQQQVNQLEGHDIDFDYYAYAALFGHLHIIQWLHESTSLNCDGRAIDSAAGEGHLHIIQYIHTHKPNIRGSSLAIDRAAAKNYMPVVQWLHTHQNLTCTTSAIDECAALGNLTMIQYLHEQLHTPCSRKAMDNAAANGHLEIVQWLHENRTEGSTRQAINLSAAKGHLDIVRWLQQNRGMKCTWVTLYDATLEDRSLSDLEWIDSQILDKSEYRIQFNNQGYSYDICKAGRLNSVKFMVSRKLIQIHSGCLDVAAGRGHLELLKWLTENSNEKCVNALTLAAENGQLEAIKWLHQNRGERYTFKAMDKAAEMGHFEVVKWLHAHRMEGCSKEAMDMAAANGHLDIVKFLHKNRKEGCTTNAFIRASRFGHLEVVQWLFNRRREDCRDVVKAISLAESEGYESVAAWLRTIVHDTYENGASKVN
jgi:ankyrin repeat protein